MPIEGDLRDMSLPNLLQTICLDQRKVTVTIQNEGEKGYIFSEKGEIVHATIGHLEAEEAIYYLLNWEEGTFRVDNHAVAPRRTIYMPWQSLLLEGANRLDNQRADQQEPELNQAALSPTDIEHDSRLENDLVILLSELEQVQTRLVEKSSGERLSAILRVLGEITNSIVDFSDKWTPPGSSANSVRKALLEMTTVNPAARLLKVQNNRISVQTAAEIFENWTGDTKERRETLQQLLQSLLNVVEAHFALLTNRFKSRSIADQWRDTFNVFLIDLNSTLDSILAHY